MKPALLPTDPLVRGTPLQRHLHGLHQLVGAGGPVGERAVVFSAWIAELADMIEKGHIDRDKWLAEWRAFMTTQLQNTTGAMALLKPHGYAGDFEIINAIYNGRVADRPSERVWDEYFHSQAAPIAVRNRKSYFQKTVSSSLMAAGKTVVDDFRVLNMASGPGRDMTEWLTNNPHVPARFDCVELDSNAIAFASEACHAHQDRVRFHHSNALRFRTEDRFNLCWSSGLFDYLSDSLFVRLLRTMLSHTCPGGEVVIGNFGPFNPSRHYMELLGDWVLEHRSPEHLRELALDAGAAEQDISVGREPACVNLFLHVRKPSRPR